MLWINKKKKIEKKRKKEIEFMGGEREKERKGIILV